MVFTPNAAIRQQLSVVWGVQTFLVPAGVAHRPDGRADRRRAAGQQPRAAAGEVAVVIAGVPPGVSGTVNGLRVHVIGTGAVERSICPDRQPTAG